MSRSRVLALALSTLAVAGCGDETEADKRGAALECLREEKDLEARAVGRNSIQVGDRASGPRIRFYLTGPAAEAAQFEGGNEGSEQIGSALLFTRQASEDLLEEVETCLHDL
jgi:hypothetical protein